MRWVWPLLLLAGCQGQTAIAPGKIVSNNPCIDAVLAEIAEPAQIGAVSSWSHAAESASAPVAWARQFPALGTQAEDIIAARPRLALTGDLSFGGTNAALTKAGLTPLAFGVPATISESRDQVQRIARAIGQDARGAELLTRIDMATRQRPATGKSAILWQGSGFVAGKGTVQDEMLARAGYRNASSVYGLGQWQSLPLETLVRTPPDIIFTPVGGSGEEGRALSVRMSALKRLAPRTRIIAFPDHLLNCAGPGMIAAMDILARP